MMLWQKKGIDFDYNTKSMPYIFSYQRRLAVADEISISQATLHSRSPDGEAGSRFSGTCARSS